MDGNYEMYGKAAAFIGAALVMGIGSIGPALGQGLISQKACEAVGKSPDSYKKIRAIMLFGLIMVETSAIYCFVISILLVLSK
jgi:F-type H+-transporting ATPase subunit c